MEDEIHAGHFDEPTPAPKKVIHLKRRERRTVSLMKHIEVLLVADYAMTKFYENRDLEHYLFTVMNMVSIHFTKKTDLRTIEEDFFFRISDFLRIS